MANGFGFGGDGPGFGFDPSGIDAWLTGAIAAILSALSYIWAVLMTIAQWLYDAVISLAKFIASHIAAAAKALAHLAEKLYPNIIQPIIKELVKIEQWLQQRWFALEDLFHNFIGELVKIWQFLRDRFFALEDLFHRVYGWYVKYIQKWQLLAVNIISALRLSIELFKLLGFKWAQKLDASLATIQGYISESILKVIQTVNAITNWLDFMSNPLGLLRKQFWQTSVFTNMKDIMKASNLAGFRTPTAAQKQTTLQNQQLMDPNFPTVTGDAPGAPVYSPQMQSIVDNLNAAAKYYNPTVPGYIGPESA